MDEEIILLKWDEPKNAYDMAMFIIRHTYYFLRYFHSDKLILNKNKFSNYLKNFKNLFKSQIIRDEFSFDLMNNFKYNYTFAKYQFNESKTDYFYNLKYKQFINIMSNQNGEINNKRKIINSDFSIRYSLVFLEYLLLLLQKYPDKISHYIIKINISLLLSIPEETGKRITNSDEFFCLNLIELKQIFPKIDYNSSSFIQEIDQMYENAFLSKSNELKRKKLLNLKFDLNELSISLTPSNVKKYVTKIKNNLSNDLEKNNSLDELLQKYIYDIEKYKRKDINQILNDFKINENFNECNYLYLIALNSDLEENN